MLILPLNKKKEKEENEHYATMHMQQALNATKRLGRKTRLREELEMEMADDRRRKKKEKKLTRDRNNYKARQGHVSFKKE